MSYLLESLKRWGINDGDLLYVFIRHKDQPGRLEFATLPEVDHNIGTDYIYIVLWGHILCIGQESFLVETPFLPNFTVSAYIDSDSPEDIAQKVYSITNNIPVPYMSLYVR